MKELISGGSSDGGLSFHERWTQRKIFRTHLPKSMLDWVTGVGVRSFYYMFTSGSFFNLFFGVQTDLPLNSKRMLLIKKRYRREIIVHGPIPFSDADVHNGLFEKVSDPVKDDVSITI